MHKVMGVGMGKASNVKSTLDLDEDGSVVLPCRACASCPRGCLAESKGPFCNHIFWK